MAHKQYTERKVGIIEENTFLYLWCVFWIMDFFLVILGIYIYDDDDDDPICWKTFNKIQHPFQIKKQRNSHQDRNRKALIKVP